jgi:hypothetical protein
MSEAIEKDKKTIRLTKSKTDVSWKRADLSL